MTTNYLKQIFILLVMLLSIITIHAQVPNLVNYQAVARNNAGQALANQSIKVRLSILKNAVSYYSETRELVTNPLGLFNVQIGSPGALATTGNFTTINWQNNADPGYVLKVELDVTNSGLFTEMGFQKLVSVPYAFASKEANHATTSDFTIHADTAEYATASLQSDFAESASVADEVININQKPIDTNDIPLSGERLMFNGTHWTSVKKDTVMMKSGAISNIPVLPANPWQHIGIGPGTAIITVSGNETILANYVGTFGHTSESGVLVSVAVCYSDANGNNITAFAPGLNYLDATVLASPTKTQLSALGSVKLNAGTYRIGMCIKNKSIQTTISANDNVNGVIEIRY